MEKNLVVVSDSRGRTALTNLRNAAFVGGVSVLTGLTAVSAHADDTLDVTGLTTQMSTAKSAILGLFAVGLVILGIFLGFKYLKKGASAA